MKTSIVNISEFRIKSILRNPEETKRSLARLTDGSINLAQDIRTRYGGKEGLKVEVDPKKPEATITLWLEEAKSQGARKNIAALLGELEGGVVTKVSKDTSKKHNPKLEIQVPSEHLQAVLVLNTYMQIIML